ncbi:MAG: hypothetical protein IMZ67_07150 [Acidobacteria bacterium]|nr:hypothetical protein [Acidobacteriota bacterium]MBE3132612.1 hypothetical protein [Acidobacteriota bacterium]
MPHLQKLFDKVKGRTDIQIVTFNVDDNIGAVAPFMKENKYTFPVVFAGFLLRELVPSLGIPLNWIVDIEGVVRLEDVGFGGNADQWVDQMLEALEKARPSAGKT